MASKPSNTTPKLRGGITGKGFVKGDPRINRKGRPKSFDALRTLALSVAHEPAKTKDGKPVVIDGHIATNAEVILRMWAASPDFRKQQAFVEISFGKVPNETHVAGPGGKELFNMQDVLKLMSQADELLAETSLPDVPKD